jgi:hypothetical protein
MCLLLSLSAMSLDTFSSCMFLSHLLTSIDLVPIMKFTCLCSLQGFASKDGQIHGKAKSKRINDSDGEEASAPCKAAKQGQLGGES